MTNQPTFDPLNCTSQEQAEMALGYSEAYGCRPWSRDSLAYAWGRGSAGRDRGDLPDAQRQDVERRIGEIMRKQRKDKQ